MFDATTPGTVTDELNERILHGRDLDIIQIDGLAFALEIYA